MRLCVVVAAAAGLTACGGTKRQTVEVRPVGAVVMIPAPLGLPPSRIPSDNPPTTETIALGEKLFFSPMLSVDQTVSCAACHDPQKAFADGRQTSEGVAKKTGKRNAPTVLNSAYYETLFWDGRAESLEAQAEGPMMNPVEMAHSVDGIEKRCASDPKLRAMFEAAFGAGVPVSFAGVTKALAAYERTLLSGNSPFDRFQYAGQRDTLSPAAQRGLAVFRDPKKANCAVCHTIEDGYALFTDNKFHNLGVGMNPEGELTDLGRYLITRIEAQKGAFRTPSLRNVARTAPYMHDGSLRTLKEVVDFYVGGGNANPQRDPAIKPLTHLTGEERADLVAFLESLNGDK